MNAWTDEQIVYELSVAHKVPIEFSIIAKVLKNISLSKNFIRPMIYDSQVNDFRNKFHKKSVKAL
jgi:hypothetical protein